MNKRNQGKDERQRDHLSDRDPSKNPLVIWIPIILAILGAIGGVGAWVWQQRNETNTRIETLEREKREREDAERIRKEDQARIAKDQETQRNEDLQKQAREDALANQALNQRLRDDYLIKIRDRLTATGVIAKELQTEYTEPGWGILESYVLKVQRDGPEKHSLMLQRINRLISINEDILTLLDLYSPHIMSEEFRIESNAFREHAQRYSDRFKALSEVIKGGQQLPTAQPFPQQFPVAVNREIDLRNRKMTKKAKTQ